MNRFTFGVVTCLALLASASAEEAKPAPPSPAPADAARPYGWALDQLRVPEAHQVTTGSAEVIVAVIDLGFRPHPALEPHLWRNPHPTKGDLHGWDFMDDDATLEYNGPAEGGAYLRNHHVFVAGEVAAVAPACRIMLLKVGYERRHESWSRAVRYAVEHGARVLVMPHGYIRRAPGGNVPLVYAGTDFSYPEDNLDLRRALDEAYDRGCLIFSGTADNLGRRVAAAPPAFAAVCAVGSSNRLGQPASVAASADYVEFGAPSGQAGKDEEVTGYGADGITTTFHGGCMSAGFAGGVGALARSRYPALSSDELRQVLRNTATRARGVTTDARGWESRLGFGLLDARAAVSLPAEKLCRDVRLVESSIKFVKQGGGRVVEAVLENCGAFDAERAMIVAYNGDPTQPAAPEGTFATPIARTTWQLGHAMAPVRGLHRQTIRIELNGTAPPAVWFETFCLDRHDKGHVHRLKVTVPQ